MNFGMFAVIGIFGASLILDNRNRAVIAEARDSIANARPGQAPDLDERFAKASLWCWILLSVITGPLIATGPAALRTDTWVQLAGLSIILPVVCLGVVGYRIRRVHDFPGREALTSLRRDPLAIVTSVVAGVAGSFPSAIHHIFLGPDLLFVGVFAYSITSRSSSTHNKFDSDESTYAPSEKTADEIGQLFYAVADSTFGEKIVRAVFPETPTPGTELWSCTIQIAPEMRADQISIRSKNLPSRLSSTFGGEWIVGEPSVVDNTICVQPAQELSPEDFEWRKAFHACFGKDKVVAVGAATEFSDDGKLRWVCRAELADLLVHEIELKTAIFRSQVGSRYRVDVDATNRIVQVFLAPVLPELVEPDPLALDIDPHTPLFLGIDEDGERVEYDLAGGAHMLIAGATRSGKSLATYNLLGYVASMPAALLLIADPNDTTVAPFERHAFWPTSDITPAEPTAMLLWVREQMNLRKPILREMLVPRGVPWRDATKDLVATFW